jgi:6-phosphogluconolactonase (cycloisomerase 2 family)
MSERLGIVRVWAWIITVVALSALTGCSGFFVAPDNSGGGGGTTTGNRAYVANSANSTVAGFTVGTGTLVAVPNSPVSLGYAPVAAVTTPTNSFLYIAGPGAIYVYTINSDGSLTASSSGAAVAIVNVVALDISPDGNWLFGLDGTTTVVDQFQINTSTGALTSVAATPYSVANAVVAPKAIRVAPNGALVFAALGTGGDVVFTFNTTTGALVSSQTLAPASATTSDNGLAVNSTTTNLYIARSGTNGGVAAFNIGAAGALTSVAGSPFTAGTGTNDVVIDSTGKYVYAANRTDGTISGFAIGTTAALTALTGSPYASGSQVISLGIDQSGKYLLAAAFGGAPDLTMYSFDITVPGKLDPATSVATGTDPAGAVALALTH